MRSRRLPLLAFFALPACGNPVTRYNDGDAQGCEEGTRDGAEEGEADGAACDESDDPPQAPLPRLLAGDSWNDGYRAGYAACWSEAYEVAFDEASFEADCPLE